jgi:hypothetical protein
MFKVSLDGPPGNSGYLNCNDLRKFRQSAEEFDLEIRNKILLSKEDMSSQESETLWELFQYKFNLTNDLLNYAPFAERVIIRILKGCVTENVFICELRHIFGLFFDDNRNALTPEQELKIYDKCLKVIQKDVPMFDIKIIVSGLKAIGKDHI